MDFAQFVLDKDALGFQVSCFLPCSDAGNQDRVVIQELIKTVAQSQQIQSSTQREFKGIEHTTLSLALSTHIYVVFLKKTNSFGLHTIPTIF